MNAKTAWKSLCEQCLRASEDRCGMYRKAPDQVVLDCGRLIIDTEKTTVRELMQNYFNKGGKK